MTIDLKEYFEKLFGIVKKDHDELKQDFKDHLKDTADVIHRPEYDKKHEDLLRKSERLETRMANLMGRAIIFAIVGAILLAILGAFTGHLFS